MTTTLSWGERIRTLRSRMKLDQDAMGAEIGLSREWISKLETGKEEPSERVRLKVEKIEREQGLHFGEPSFTSTPPPADPIVAEGETEELQGFSFRFKTAFRASKTATTTGVAGQMGVPATRVEEWRKGQRMPRAAELRKLATILGVRAEWLSRGEGVVSEALQEENQAPYGIVFPREVGVVSWSHAGAAASYEEIPKDWREKVVTSSRDRRAFGVVVEGDCMEPKYLAGDILILEPTSEPRSGKPVVAKLADDAVQVRIYTKMPGGRIRLASMKPEIYPTIEYTLRDFHWIFPVHQMVRNE